MKRKLLAALLALMLALSLLPARGLAAQTQIAVGFIDSGVSTKHIDPAQILPGRNYVFPEKDTQDRIGHGTATAGMLLGAPDQGVTGVFPEAAVVPLVVVDAYPSGVVKNGGTEALCAAIRDAVDEFGCRIVNISLSAGTDSQELRAAVDYAEAHGVLLVAAVGNGGADGTVAYPAAYETVVAVGSAEGDSPAAFSQPGADFLTRGVGLTAATHRNSTVPVLLSGTSYSCALVTGLCARLLNADPTLTPRQLREGLRCLARDLLTPGYDAESGWGLLETDAAIPEPFFDVPSDHAFRDGIVFAAEAGWMDGVGGGRFAPDAALTRAMLANVLWRMAGMPRAEAPADYDDVEEGTWYAAAVAWASEAGLVKGCGAARFAPAQPLCREQLAVILFRYAGQLGLQTGAEPETLAPYADAESVSAWASDAMGWAISAQLLRTTAEQMLDARRAASRGEVAETLMRFVEMTARL